ncbi:polysaccharide pyruvyl transferase family protein [Microlunatus elymi]|uniref:Polysaccharide pyruvyl transferase family protein n=1 Tax=Microlunatus elymi TaxID=2596828 RepID=A0A516Q086_9ACTN|nr:polysaccharide pyruvyl transferase family protein [Microlunatus elymi]QDP96843.1 polysaccharide pyruvyl transferase family protein [Microlunatus elymi]
MPRATLAGTRRRAGEIDQAVTDFVRAALRHGSGPIGVRGEYTRDYLVQLGFGDDDVMVIGCPSMFMYGPDLKIVKSADALADDARIALNISPYVRQLGPLSQRHAERYPNLIYLAQNDATLQLLITGRYPAKPTSATFRSGVPVTVDHPLIRQDRVRFFLDPTPWIEHLKSYRFSFGSRIHGNIAALLAGTPALVLAHDSRTRELADYHRIPARLITDRPEQIDAAELYASADWQPLNDGHAERWQIFRSFLRQHGLPTVYDDGQDRGAAFDARLSRTSFPPPVRTPLGATTEELFAMRAELAQLRQEVSETRRRLDADRDSRRRFGSELARRIRTGARISAVANARKLAGGARRRVMEPNGDPG